MVEGSEEASSDGWETICKGHASTRQCKQRYAEGGEARRIVLDGTDSVTSATGWYQTRAGGMGRWICDRSQKVLIFIVRSGVVVR